MLGPLEVEGVEDHALLRRRKPRALLALLLLNANRPVSTGALLEGLWGEEGPPSAHGALQNYVSQLRKTLGRDVVLTRAPGYMLSVEPEELDLLVFERLLAEAATADTADRAVLLREALALWRGPPLAEFTDEPFAALEAVRLQAMHLAATEELLAIELELGRHAALVPELERLVREQPLSERLRGLLMLALYRAGRQADALSAYREGRRILDDELGLEPGEELQRLERAILTHDPSLELPAPPPDAEPVPLPHEVRTDRRTVTVLFADVSGSTALGESLDPEALRTLMSSFFNEMRTVVERHGGTVEKFSGDEVMAVFGAPVAHEDDALRAVRAAQEMLTAVDVLDQSLDEERGARFRVRIGINTGEVVAGAASAGGTFVTGSAVVLGKRLQEMAEPGTSVIGASTMLLVRNAVETKPLGARDVRGAAERIEAFRVVAVDPGAPGVARALDTPIVGRDTELAALRAAFDVARDDSMCRLVALLGDAGIGKTRLARELVEQLEAKARVLVGRCVAYGDGATYLPVVDSVRDVLPDLETALAGEEDGAAILETVSTLVEGDDDAPVPAAETAWAVRRAFEALARDRPLLVVFDDVHWGEPTFLDLLEYLAAWSQDAPILLLALARPEMLETRAAWAASDAAIETISMRPLGDEETRTLVANLATSLDEEQRERVAVLADGFPLFAEQLVAYIEEAVGELDLEAVPPTIEALLASRLARLDGEERDVLERAAVVGREFWRGAVAALTPDGDRAAVGRHLISLVRKAFVQPARSELPREDALRFRHVLVRDVTYGAIPKATRAQLHEGAADWLERRAGQPEEVVGYHLEQAYRYRSELGPGDRQLRRLGADAGERLGRAGVRALARGDSPAAVNLLTRATTLLPTADRFRLTLLSELGLAHRLAGDLEAGREVLTTAVAEAASARDRRLELRAQVELAFARVDSEPEAANDVLTLQQTALPLFEALGDDRSLGRLWFAVGFVEGAFFCRNAAWEDAAERALAHYRETKWSTATCLSSLVCALFYGPRPVAEAIARCDALLEKEVTDLAGEAHVTIWRGALQALRGDFDDARRAVASARRTYEALGQPTMSTVVCDGITGYVEMLAEDFAAAETILRSSAESLQRSGLVPHLANRAAELADALYALGRYAEAEEWATTARRHSAPTDVSAQFTWRAVAAKLRARDDDVQEAARLAEEAVELVDGTDAVNQRASVRLDQAHVLLLAGRGSDAAATARAAAELFELKGNVVGAERARGLTTSIRA
jgi:class 3 adenylate cyclase/tetratricopeptide (TPR) repeat protein